jgi:hypothetical protein
MDLLKSINGFILKEHYVADIFFAYLLCNRFIPADFLSFSTFFNILESAEKSIFSCNNIRLHLTILCK